MSDAFVGLTGVDGKRVLLRLGEILYAENIESLADDKRTKVTMQDDTAFWVKETVDEIAEMIANA